MFLPPYAVFLIVILIQCRCLGGSEMTLLTLPGESVTGIYVCHHSPTLIPLSGVGKTCFSSCCDKDSAIIFTTGRLPDYNPSWEWNGIMYVCKTNRIFSFTDSSNTYIPITLYHHHQTTQIFLYQNDLAMRNTCTYNS
jgi:hypothetical protein